MSTIKLPVCMTDDEWTISGHIEVAAVTCGIWGNLQPTIKSAELERWAFDYEYFEEMDDQMHDEWAQRALEEQRPRLLASPEWAALVAEAGVGA